MLLGTLLTTIVVLTTALTGPFVGSAGAQSDRVVLLSWDGVRHDKLFELMHWRPIGETPPPCPSARHDPIVPQPCGAYWSCLPNICEFQVLESFVVEGKPLTRPQHAQMLSGYGPLETGEITNAGKRSLPEGMSIYERIKAGRGEVLTGHIAGRKFVGKGIVKYARRNGSLDRDERRGGRDGYTGDKTTFKRFVPLLDDFADSPFFIFVHYKMADVRGHRAGDGSTQYLEGVIWDDVQLGNVLQELDNRGLLNTTKVYVTTDHGFDGIFHVNIETVSIHDTWFASHSHDLMAVDGTVLDVTPTVLTALGIDISSIEPPFRGQSLLAGPLP